MNEFLSNSTLGVDFHYQLSSSQIPDHLKDIKGGVPPETKIAPIGDTPPEASPKPVTSRSPLEPSQPIYGKDEQGRKVLIIPPQ
jgi:hypothetical protein